MHSRTTPYKESEETKEKSRDQGTARNIHNFERVAPQNPRGTAQRSSAGKIKIREPNISELLSRPRGTCVQDPIRSSYSIKDLSEAQLRSFVRGSQEAGSMGGQNQGAGFVPRACMGQNASSPRRKMDLQLPKRKAQSNRLKKNIWGRHR